jgi:hypothetical protein
MSEVKVNKISPRTNCGTVTLGDSGDTFTIPSGATITNAGTATGFGATGEISWDTTVKTTGTFTATAGVGYFCNTSGGTITVNLPAGTAGNSVALADYAGTWQTSKVTISPNGSDKIGGVSEDVDLTTEGQSVTFVYIDGTQGWVNVLDSTSNVRANEFIIATGGCISTSGNCKIHKFTGPGTFCVSAIAPCAANNLVSYMVLAGGGSGASTCGPSGPHAGNAGGGGGGFRELVSPTAPYTASPLNGYPTPGNRITVTATGYPITVGGGGAVVPGDDDAPGTKGSNSIFSSITSTGGGYGGFGAGGGPGGSGGGGGRDQNSAAGGTGNTPPVTPAQGNNGGASAPGSSNSGAGGGGGAGGSGGSGSGPASPYTNEAGGNGGAGVTSEITASPVSYSGGGAAASYGGTPGTVSPVGGGGAAGKSNPASCGSAGATNRGAGGGGGSPLAGAGGSGVVIIRYKYQ